MPRPTSGSPNRAFSLALALAAQLDATERGHLRELPDVGPGNEGLVSGPREDHPPDIGVVTQITKDVAELPNDLGVECIQLLRAVDHHDGQIPVPLHTDVL